MTPTSPTKLLILVIVAVSAVGVLDAAIGEVWDLVALFTIVLVIAGALLVRTNWRRRAIRLRADHVRWLVARSKVTGEDVEHLADRVVATYRYALVTPEDPKSAAPPPGQSSR